MGMCFQLKESTSVTCNDIVAPLICEASVSYFKLDNIPYISMGESAYISMYVFIRREIPYSMVMRFLSSVLLQCRTLNLIISHTSQRRIQDFWKGGSNKYIHKRGWVLEGACPSWSGRAL